MEVVYALGCPLPIGNDPTANPYFAEIAITTVALFVIFFVWAARRPIPDSAGGRATGASGAGVVTAGTGVGVGVGVDAGGDGELHATSSESTAQRRIP